MPPGEQHSRVVMLLSNPYEPDVRAQKQAHMLALAGYDVTVIGWDRQCAYPPRDLEVMPAQLDAALADWPGRCVDSPAPVKIVRVRVPARWHAGPRHLLPKVPSFWSRLYRETRRARPAIVHAHQLDTLPVAALYGRLHSVPVVYDAREYYAGMVAPNAGPRLHDILEAVDQYLTPRAAAVLAVGERHAQRHRAMGGRVWIVHNSQPALLDKDAGTRDLRAALGIPENALVVTYVGHLTPDRLLAPVMEAVARLDDVVLVVAGDGPRGDQVRAAAAACPRIMALGAVPLTRVLPIVAAGDVVYYGLDATNPNSYYFMPNLAFFAFAAGRPLLVTPVGEIAEVVDREQCGIVMEEATAAAAEFALRLLRDDDFRGNLAARSRYLGTHEFHLHHGATQLLQAYASVRNSA
jgi:glycosyltransferase involved in cell wall biosynthesis